jgi:CO dehydrogenase maturation factor
MKGVMTAKRINELVDELHLSIKKRALIINRVPQDQRDRIIENAAKFGLEIAGLIPDDAMIAEYDLQGRAVFELPEDAVSVKALYGILDSSQIP